MWWWTRRGARAQRSIRTFLLLELRELLKRNARIKVVLMSATINQQTLRRTLAVHRASPSPAARSPCTTTISRTLSASAGPTLGQRVQTKGAANRSRRRWHSCARNLQQQDVDEETARAVESIARAGGRISYELIGAVVRYVVERAENDELASDNAMLAERCWCFARCG